MAGWLPPGSAAAREFARVTQAVLGGTPLDDAPAPGTRGVLNGNGAPLEFTFATSACGELRYTMEVDGAATAQAGRLRRIAQLLDELGVRPASDGVVGEFAALQEDAQLAWGAWLGARQPHGTREPTRYKVYAEVPPGRAARAGTLQARYLGAEAMPGQLVMVGAAPGSDRCEFYFEHGRSPFTLHRLRGLLQRMGLAGRLDELAALVCAFDFRHGQEPGALPRAQYGFSVASGPGGSEPVFALHVFAADLPGGDAGVRHQVLEAARWQRVQLRGYAALSAPLAAQGSDTSFHNMLGFSVGAQHPPAWQVSLCPPPIGVLHA